MVDDGGEMAEAGGEAGTAARSAESYVAALTDIGAEGFHFAAESGMRRRRFRQLAATTMMDTNRARRRRRQWR